MELPEVSYKTKPQKILKKALDKRKKYANTFVVFVALIFAILCVASVLEEDTEKVRYQNLKALYESNKLHPDSVKILCLLAAKLKVDIPDICQIANFKKKSGKNEKHINANKIKIAHYKMSYWKTQVDSLKQTPQKTQELKSQLKKALSQYKKFKQQYESRGEEHSRKEKR
ncbi:MAG: hypothetical protein JJT94_11525 [Bernardetiaceae bacterium]|nr:hypothetical protein [Bernardetiaceae bacterium]